MFLEFPHRWSEVFVCVCFCMLPIVLARAFASYTCEQCSRVSRIGVQQKNLYCDALRVPHYACTCGRVKASRLNVWKHMCASLLACARRLNGVWIVRSPCASAVLNWDPWWCEMSVWVCDLWPPPVERTRLCARLRGVMWASHKCILMKRRCLLRNQLSLNNDRNGK